MITNYCENRQICFGKKLTQDGKHYYCEPLSVPIYGHCPFAKKEREVTNGVRYPYNPNYGKEKHE